MFNKILSILLSCFIIFSVISSSLCSVSAQSVQVEDFGENKLNETVGVESNHTPLDFEKNYQYSFLADNYKQAYKEILEGIKVAENVIDISEYNIPNSDVLLLIEMVCTDNPQYFYVTRYYDSEYDAETGNAKSAVLYYTDGEKVDRLNGDNQLIDAASRTTIEKQIREINAKTKEILDNISVDMTPLDKEVYIHNYLAKNIRYDYEAAALFENVVSFGAVVPFDWDIYGALIEGSAVCEGYSKAFSYLCHCVGINATLVSGWSSEERHQWNAIELDNEWYFVDVTWDDTDLDHEGLYFGYSCFNITSEFLAGSHTIETDLYYPECTATKYLFINTEYCLNFENGTVPSDYEDFIDNAIQHRLDFLCFFIDGDNSVREDLVDQFKLSLYKYIYENNCGIDIDLIFFDFQCTFLYIKYPCIETGHEWDSDKRFCGVGIKCKNCNGYVEYGDKCNLVQVSMQEATCTQEGKVFYKCTKCDGTDSEIIDAKGHDAYFVTTPSGCHTYGYTTEICRVCSSEEITEYTELLGCDFKTKVLSKATFDKDGESIVKCSRCGWSGDISKINRIESFKLSKTKYTYNGKAQKPSVNVYDSVGKKLVYGKDYTYTCPDSKLVGKYKVKITFKGKYSGTKTLYYKITPAKTQISKLTAYKNKIKVKVSKKIKQVTGYEIQYSTSKDFKSAKTKTIKKASTTSLTIKSLKAKKTYYVRVRTYKTVNGKKYYSAWSTYKKKKTK